VTLPLCLVVPCRNGESLTASFRLIGGRFRHSIVLSDATGETLDHWEDVIDAASDEWPSSPPIQQLSLESIHSQPTLLGVGQAGKSHWSISVEPIAAPECQGLRFDLACRTRMLPLWLGSTYKRVHEGPSDHRQLMIQAENGQVNTNNPFAIDCELNRESDAPFPITFRWSYILGARDLLRSES
jgi:hypothetical protein